MKPKYHRADFLNMRFNRTSHEGRVIFPTTPQMVEAMGYLAAHCLHACDLEVYALTLFFTHGHGDLGHPVHDADPETTARFSDFYELFNFLIFRVLNAHGWKYGPVFNRRERTHDAPSLDGDQLLDDLAYDMAQAVKAGLFKHAADYPGLCLLPENVTKPRVFKRNHLIDAIDPERERFPEDELSIQLGVPACFRHLGRQAYQELLQAHLDAYEAEHAHPRASTLRGLKACESATLGKQFEKTLNRLKTRGKLPRTSNPGPPPPYTSKPELRTAFFAERRDFWSKHEAAAKAVWSGEANVVFPAGTYGRTKIQDVPISCDGPPCWAGEMKWHPG